MTVPSKGRQRKRCGIYCIYAKYGHVARYVDYFLIVWDYITYARKQGIPVGPGRGSGAGSICAYCMGITQIDPLPYHLLFERFLNPERGSMPDFDIGARRFLLKRQDTFSEYIAV